MPQPTVTTDQALDMLLKERIDLFKSLATGFQEIDQPTKAMFYEGKVEALQELRTTMTVLRTIASGQTDAQRETYIEKQR